MPPPSCGLAVSPTLTLPLRQLPASFWPLGSPPSGPMRPSVFLGAGCIWLPVWQAPKEGQASSSPGAGGGGQSTQTGSDGARGLRGLECLQGSLTLRRARPPSQLPWGMAPTPPPTATAAAALHLRRPLPEGLRFPRPPSALCTPLSEAPLWVGVGGWWCRGCGTRDKSPLFPR